MDEGLDAARLRQGLGPWVAEFRYLPEVDSTNAEAARWAHDGAPDGSLVVTDHQFAGRGRLDRTWEAAPGTCLLFSLILRPPFDRMHWGLLPLAAGVAVCDAVRAEGIEAALKWPNDVLAGGRKLAGILAEAVPGALLLGIGINVNVGAFAPHLRAGATSMSLAAGRSFDRVELLHAVVGGFDALYSSAPAGLADRYRARCATLGTVVKVECPGESVEDVAEDIDHTGALLLAGGTVVKAGDVVHVRQGAG